MSSGLSKTFDHLSSTANAHAVDVLIHALDSKREPLVDKAVDGLLNRRSMRGHVDVIRRLDSLTANSRALVEQRLDSLAKALRQCLLHGDTELCRCALELVRATEDYQQFSSLLELLEKEDNELHEPTIQTIVDLTNRLYEHCTHSSGTAGKTRLLRDPREVRRKVLNSLDQACSNFDRLTYGEKVVEAILQLGQADHFSVKKVLSQASAECRQLARHLLCTSVHPGVMQLSIDCMSKPYPPLQAFEAIQTRTDPEFICHLLRWFPKRLSQTQADNFQQIESVAWLDPQKLSLELALQVVPQGVHSGLAMFVTATGMPTDVKGHIQEWLLKNGDAEGRNAATDALASLDGHVIEGLLEKSLDSEDAEVQAWATGQLRAHGVDSAIAILIERLDSPMPEVCEAARKELESFDFNLMLGIFDHLDPRICRKAGEIIQKTDNHCIEKLIEQLEHPIRRRRIVAARAAQALGLHGRVVASLVDLLDDSDALVRRTVAEVLGDTGLPVANRALAFLVDDPSPRVRDVASKALERFEQLQHASSPDA